MKNIKKNEKINQNNNSNSISNSYFTTSPISNGLILLGIILFLVYCFYSVVSANPPSESIHEDQIRGSGSFDWVIPISLILIIIGAVFLFINHQFDRLSEFAQEVESGDFEKKVLEELDNE
jgi:hypothetical protein